MLFLLFGAEIASFGERILEHMETSTGTVCDIGVEQEQISTADLGAEAMRLIDVDEIMNKIVSAVSEINGKLETAKAPSVDYLTGMRRGLIDAYFLLNGLTVTNKETDYETN